MEKLDKNILVIGNFPWVTNAHQGVIGSKNLPQKTNFQERSGLDAITGKSNFDISEWMLIRMIQCLQKRKACLAMLCKTSVSRKLLSYIYSQGIYLEYCAIYKIDAKNILEQLLMLVYYFVNLTQSQKTIFAMCLIVLKIIIITE